MVGLLTEVGWGDRAGGQEDTWPVGCQTLKYESYASEVYTFLREHIIHLFIANLFHFNIMHPSDIGCCSDPSHGLCTINKQLGLGPQCIRDA